MSSVHDKVDSIHIEVLKRFTDVCFVIVSIWDVDGSIQALNLCCILCYVSLSFNAHFE